MRIESIQNYFIWLPIHTPTAPFGAACIPAASADNETERVAITTRMFTDLETVLAEGGAVEGEFICELLEHIAKSASPIQVTLMPRLSDIFMGAM